MGNSSFILQSEWIARVVFYTTAVIIRYENKLKLISQCSCRGGWAAVIPDKDKLKAISHAKHWPEGKWGGGFGPL